METYSSGVRKAVYHDPDGTGTSNSIGPTMRYRRSIDQLSSAERHALGEFARKDPLWPGQLALATVIILTFTLPERVIVGPKWVMPAAEAVGFIGLITATPLRNPHYSRGRRMFSLTLIGLVSATYLASLYLLVHFLVKGGKTGGHPLIVAGIVLWVDNVLLFAIWYWLLDRAGPLPHPESDARPDFMFSEMNDEARRLYPEWAPNFVDYLYLSITNASAFSPTDTLPLTRLAKLTMGIQSVASLVTVGLVLARAVNILS